MSSHTLTSVDDYLFWCKVECQFPNDQHKTSEKGEDDHTKDVSKTIPVHRPVVIKETLNLQDVDTHQSFMKKLEKNLIDILIILIHK